MRTVVPISHADQEKLHRWLEVVKHLNCLQQHDVFFLTTHLFMDDAINAQQELAGFAASTDIITVDIEPSKGWPYGPNSYFWYAANRMAQNPSIPWQLVEADCLPIRSNSFDMVAARYASIGTPFMGKVGPTPWRDPKTGKITPSGEGPGDVMMSGNAVYPGNLPMLPNFRGLIDDFMKGEDSTDQPWDMHLRYAMKRIGMGHTDLIADHWNTINYRMEDGALICDANPEHEIYAKNPTWEIRDCSGTINPSAVFIHGCKDDSLYNLIMADSIPEVIASKRTVIQKTGQIIQPQHQVAPADEKVAKLEDKVDKLASLMQALLEKQVEKHTEKPKPVAEIPASTVTVTADDVVVALEGKKAKIADLAQKLSINSRQLRSIITDNPTKLTIANGPAGWIGAITP